MTDINKALEAESGFLVNDSSNEGPFYTGGSSSPVGLDAPTKTIYVQTTSSGIVIWQKYDTGTNDWRKYPASQVSFDNTTSLLFGTDVQSIGEEIGGYKENNILYVRKNGDDSTADGSRRFPFQTIESAITYINSNYTPAENNQYSIEVGPGEYIEDPLTMPNYVSLNGAEESSTTILANNENANLLTLGTSTSINHLRLEGVTNASNYLIYFNTNDTGGSLINNIRVINCSNGIYFNRASGGLTFTSIRKLRAGGNITGTVITFDNNVNATIFDTVAGGLSTFMEVGAGSLITSIGGRVTGYSTRCFYIKEDATITINGMDLAQAVNNPPIVMEGEDSLAYIISCIYDDSLVSLSKRANYRVVINSTHPGEEALLVTEELHVGSPEIGRESVFGEGDSFVRGMLVYSYNGSTFTDVTSDVNVKGDGNSSSFANTSVNTSFYISCDLESLYKFFGIKVELTQAKTGGAIVAEYWNGSSWVSFSHMSEGEIDVNYTKYGKVLFERAKSEQITFDNSISSSWVANDPVSLGKNLYWIRFRISSALTTVPTFDYIKIHSNRTEINADGFVQYFGKARRYKLLSSDIKFDAAINSPANQDIYISDNIAVGKAENNFFEAGLLSNSDQAGAVFKIPSDCDTSTKLRLRLSYTCTSTGTVVFDAYWNHTKRGDSVYQSAGGAPSTSPGEKTTQVSQSYTTANTLNIMQFDLDISDAIPRTSDLFSDLLWIGLRINNASTTDPVTLINVTLEYLSNESGGHLVS